MAKAPAKKPKSKKPESEEVLRQELKAELHAVAERLRDKAIKALRNPVHAAELVAVLFEEEHADCQEFLEVEQEAAQDGQE